MNRYDKEYFGIRVTLPDGSYNWYDPCDKEPYTTDDGITVVESTMYAYEYTIPITWEKYPLCSECGYEVDKDDWCKYDCPLCNRGDE